MSKQCFVIMPYGSSSPELKKKFDGVYKGIIMPAVREAGYEPVREDISGTPGNIPKSIVTKLAKSEMVIADLTGMNPNVFYELGIRHVMSKNGTVLIINKGDAIPFDNAIHRVVQYTNELDDLDTVHQQIVTAIKNRENSVGNPDNIVHDTFHQLPSDILKSLDVNIVNAEFSELQKSFAEVKNENERYKKMLLSGGLLSDKSQEEAPRSVKELFSTVRDALAKSGRSVIIRLSQFASNGDTDGFVEFLESVLEAGFVSEDDYIQINNLCDKLGLLPLQVAIMEHAHGLFPESERIAVQLSQVYIQMPLRETKLKGVEIAENLLDIVYENSIVTIRNPRLISDSKIATLFNAYGQLDFYERTLAFCNAYEKLDLSQSAVILRNKADAFAELQMIEDAKAAYKALLNFDYNNDTNHSFYAGFLSEQGDYIGAYKEREIALALDPNDASRYMNLAIEVLNHHFLRENENLISRQTNREKLIKAILPMFIYAINISTGENVRHRVVEILYRQNLKDYAEKILSGQPIDMSNMNEYPLSYIRSLTLENIAHSEE